MGGETSSDLPSLGTYVLRAKETNDEKGQMTEWWMETADGVQRDPMCYRR